MRRQVFVTGGTGHIGRALVRSLLERSHDVTLLVRPGSESKAPSGTRVVIGDALRSERWASEVPRAAVFVHLVGTPSPAPWKAAEFERVDLGSVRAALDAAVAASASHFVYLSVAQPAPVMRAYVSVRARGEQLVVERFTSATIVRPWYVLGPGRRWPLALLPIYWIAGLVPACRDGARRLGFVTQDEMTLALVDAIESGGGALRVLDVPAIRAASRRTSPGPSRTPSGSSGSRSR